MSTVTIVGLIVIGYILAIIEIFVPGGIFGIIGTGLIITGVLGSFFVGGASIGIPLGFGCLLAGVILFAFWVNYFPKSWVGKMINLEANNARTDGYVSQAPGLADLVGQEGVAQTDLRPAGVALIAGKRIDVVTEGMFVDKGSTIVVANVDSNRVVVRQV
jgi:membrane-bound serine protease (ClpP class)